jgi:hypothetical protein
MTISKSLLASAVLVVLTVSVGQANAFGLGKLKDLGKEDKPAATTTDSSSSTSPQASATATSEPMQFKNEKFGYVVDMPANWQKLTGDATSNMVLFNHVQVSNGGFTINATPMNSDFPTDTSLSAQEKDYKERQKRGELSKVYRKDFSDKSGALFKGYVTIETDKDNDPDIQRMQWIGYGKDKTYYNFTWSTNNTLFPDRLPEFEKILGTIQFTK